MKRGIVDIQPDTILRLLDYSYSEGGKLVGIEYDPFNNVVRACIEHQEPKLLGEEHLQELYKEHGWFLFSHELFRINRLLEAQALDMINNQGYRRMAEK